MKGTSKQRPSLAGQDRHRPKPTLAQVLRQLGAILVVLAVWTGLLVGTLSLTGRSDEPVVGSPPPTDVVAASTVTATQPRPAGTGAPAFTATASEPPAVASDTPAAEPTATESLPTPAFKATAPAASGISFAAEVLPVLQARCERCHGEQRKDAGLKLTSYADLMAGSENGPVIVPGSAATSYLIELIVSGDMPRRSPRLPESEIVSISTWVDEGALDN